MISHLVLPSSRKRRLTEKVMPSIPSTRSLKSFDGTGWRALLLLVLSLSACANARILAQADSSRRPASLPTTATTLGSTPPPTRTARRAEVIYAGGLLTVVASNSSLNQILRETAHQTGMKITGGVAEDRVFGTYGPAPPSQVLATLLDGTGTNLLLVQDASHAPTELILTPRIGAATPPNPNAPNFEDNDSLSDDAPQEIRSVPPAPVLPSIQPANSRNSDQSGTGGIDTNPAATSPSSTTQQLAFPPVDATTPPATATITPTTPDTTSDTVKTPQQIFEQLQKLRQQQTQQPKPQ